MDTQVKAQLIGWLIGGGAIALIASAFKGISAMRLGVRAQEKESVVEIGAARRAAVERAVLAEHDATFWARVAARYARQLERHGIQPDPSNPVPPSEEHSDGDGPRAADRR